jgi:hypothetical protein
MTGTWYTLSLSELLNIYPDDDLFGLKMSYKARNRRIKKKCKPNVKTIKLINNQRSDKFHDKHVENRKIIFFK